MEGSRQPFSPPVSPASMARETAAFARALAENLATDGPHDPATLAARARLGRAYAFAGRFSEAVVVLTENLAASDRALGTDHAETIVARSELAWARRCAGHIADPLASQERCIADLDRVLGPGTAEAAKARIEYARLLISTGQLVAARQHLEQATANLGQSVASDHPDALCCRMWLAYVQIPERADQSVSAAEQTAAECERLLEPDDPEAISCRAMLGAIYDRVGRLDEALGLLGRACADFHRVLGSEHTESIRTASSLAVVLSRTGSADRAIAEFEQALAVAERVLVPHHRLTVVARMHLARAYRSAGRSADAATMMEHAIRDFLPVSAQDRTQARAMRCRRAAFLSEAGLTADAITVAQDVVAEIDKAGEPVAKTAVEARLLLASLYASAARDSDANAIYRAALPDIQRLYGASDPKTKQVVARLGRNRWLHRIGGNPRTAVFATLALAAAAVIIFVVSFPRSHPTPSARHTPLSPPPARYRSPAEVAAAFTAALFTDHPAAACRYAVPGTQAGCTMLFDAFGHDITMRGSWAVGHTVISGSRAIVDIECQARTGDGSRCVNTDPNAGLPHAGLSFPAAYRQALGPSSQGLTTDCVLVDGKWYVNAVQAHS